jgi:hypothetical protein
MDESEEFVNRLREQQLNDSYNWNRLISFISDMENEGEEMFCIRITDDRKILLEATSRPDCITIYID